MAKEQDLKLEGQEGEEEQSGGGKKKLIIIIAIVWRTNVRLQNQH